LAEEKTDDDVDMSASKSSQPASGLGSRRARTTPDPQAVFGGKTKEQQEEEDERNAQEQKQDEEQRESQIKLPLWTARTVQGSIIHCIDIAQNEDAIDSTARAIDTMILSYLKDRYRLYHAWTSMASAQAYYMHVKSIKLLPEFDGYIPYVGEDAGGVLREPTEDELKASFQKHAKDGKVGGRDLEIYLRGVIMQDHEVLRADRGSPTTHQRQGHRCYRRIDDERKIEVRREATDFVRKIIAGTFAVRSYDYFRVNPPKRDDHVHLDPVELVCAVTERSRTFSVLVTLNKIGLQLPQALQMSWENKLKAVTQSDAQMETSIRTLDPSERDRVQNYIRAITDTQETEEGTASGSQDTKESKKRRKK
jgi:hypothetical protein